MLPWSLCWSRGALGRQPQANSTRYGQSGSSFKTTVAIRNTHPSDLIREVIKDLPSNRFNMLYTIKFFFWSGSLSLTPTIPFPQMLKLHGDFIHDLFRFKTNKFKDDIPRHKNSTANSNINSNTDTWTCTNNIIDWCMAMINKQQLIHHLKLTLLAWTARCEWPKHKTAVGGQIFTCLQRNCGDFSRFVSAMLMSHKEDDLLHNTKIIIIHFFHNIIWRRCLGIMWQWQKATTITQRFNSRTVSYTHLTLPTKLEV